MHLYKPLFGRQVPNKISTSFVCSCKNADFFFTLSCLLNKSRRFKFQNSEIWCPQISNHLLRRGAGAPRTAHDRATMPNILHKLASDGARASRKKGPKKLQDSQKKKILKRAATRLAANFLPKGCGCILDGPRPRVCRIWCLMFQAGKIA